MKIETRDFGPLDISEDQVINFPNGLYAFDDAKHFALIAPKENQYPMWLQCIDSLRPCFIVFDPELFCQGYRVELSGSERSMLKIKDNSTVRVLFIANVPEDFRETTVNMKSPIVINEDEKTAMQIILSENYPYRQPIYKKPGAGQEA